MKRVAILGYAESIKDAPYHDKGIEIWIPNYCEVDKANLPREPDRIFDIHPWEVIVAENQYSIEGKHHLDKMRECQIPIYFCKATPAIPCSVTYPIDELTREFFPWARKISSGKFDDAYWTSSAQLMIALAIKEEFTDIYLYGIDMADTVEYREQRKGCEYVIGFATARGINVHRPLSCPILRTRFTYGYDIEEERAYRVWLKKRKEWLSSQINQLNQTGATALNMRNQYEGMMAEIDLLEKNWLDS